MDIIKSIVPIFFGLSLITGCNNSSNSNQINEREVIGSSLESKKPLYDTLVTNKGFILSGGEGGISISSNIINRSSNFKIPVFTNKEKINRSNSNDNVKIYSIAEQKDGKIIIGGNFSSVNGVAKKSIIRLNLDGSIDSTFMLNNNGFDGEIYSIEVLDDTILLGGYFTKFGNMNVSKGLIALNLDGTLQSSFNELNSYASSVVNDILTIGNEVFIAGSFVLQEDDGTFKELCVLKIDDSKIVNNEFTHNTNGLNGNAFKLLHKNHQLLIAGDFEASDELNISDVVRLNLDGKIDKTFILPKSQGLIFDMAYDEDILMIGGSFVTENNNSLLRGFAMYKNNVFIPLKNVEIEADIYNISIFNGDVILNGEGNYTIQKDSFQNNVVLNLRGDK